MDNEWENDVGTGKAFGRGRPVEVDEDDGWGETNGGSNDGNGWGGGDSRPPRGGGRSDRGERRGGRGGGGRGNSRGGGGRSDTNGFRNNNRNNEGGWSGGGGGDSNEGGWGGGGNGNSEGGWGDGGVSGNNDDFGGERRGGRGGGGRGRGSRGGSRGGGRGGESRGDGEFGDKPSNGDDAEKPRERYIPPEPSQDENEIFSIGNETGINFDKFDEIDVKVTGENIPLPIASFQESGLRPYLLENIQKSKYTKPTPIQKHAIPIIMDGRDVMACAQTGSGKTAAFLLPILHTLLSDARDVVVDAVHCEPQAVIVSPTRELAIQIHDECRKFSHKSILQTVVAYGGTAVFHQSKKLMNGCHILVATPGRLMDFVRNGKVTFNSVRFVVLDEADRMLDMGFLPEMEKLLSHETMVATNDRQTLMFSATFPEEIQRLAGQFLNNYLFITVGIVGGACSDVTQTFYQVDKFNKRVKLLEIFKEEGTERTLVFVETKRNADFLASVLCENDFRTTSIHGDRLQREREEALGDFKSGRRNILVATGVAARGLDIKNVKHVINYDLPKGIDEYVHRIGRTGRVGNSGKATSFYDSSQDAALAKDLIKILRQAGQPIPDWLQRDENASGGGGFRSSNFGGRDVRGDDFGAPQDNFQPAQEEEW